jgi:pyruvate kinase
MWDMVDFSKKATKIICTIGPSSYGVATLRKMLRNGMTAARINTAHESSRWYKKVVDRIRRIASIPIIMDIKGPELRIRCKEKMIFPKNAKLCFGFTEKYNLRLNFNVLKNIQKGDLIMINDGKFSFKVISKGKDCINVISKENCMIEPNKNVNIPGKALNLPSLSSKDLAAIKFAKNENMEYIALSFCRGKKDVINLRKRLGSSGIKIIAKIENREGIENISEIIDSADGIMVARGDLGVELPAEEVPLIQKQIISECNQKGKAVIVATQMLESMISNPVPTRAEISDIANAILDGADCLMLSAETAIGKFPSEAVKTMSKVALEVEPSIKINTISSCSSNISDCISKSAVELARTLPITKIICLTYSGYTATRIARFRLDTPIIAITHSRMVERQLMIYYSLKPIYYKSDFWKEPITNTITHLHKINALSKEDLVLFTAGLFTVEGKKTNTIQVHKISEILESLRKNR